MFSRLLAASKRWLRRLAVVVSRREAGIGHWAAEALPSQRVRWHQNRLSEAARKLEQRFSLASTALENLAGKSALLLESSRSVLKCALGQDGVAPIFESALAVTERPLKFNDEYLEMTTKLDRELEVMAERIGRLQRFRSTLDESIAPLKILQTMFRIESASSSPEVQTLFMSLSAEIEDLLIRMSTMIASEFEGIGNTRATVDKVKVRLREIHARHVHTQKLRADAAESLRGLEAQLESNRRRDVRLVSVTEALSEKLSGMVSALQYQDILNQRLQHVERGLESIAGQATALQSAALTPGVLGNPSCAGALTFLRDAARVESAQLEDVEGVLEGAVESLRKSLHSLAEEMGELGSECTLLNGIKSPSAAGDGMVQVLLDIIRDNVEFVQSTAIENRGIRDVLEPIGQLLGNLTGNILELAARIRLIALNAQIQAAQAGDGTGLEVLSYRARSIAEEMGGIVVEIAGELAGLKDGLNGGLEDIAYATAKSQELQRFLRESGRDQELRLHEFRDRMLAEFRCVADLVSYVQTESRSLAVSLDMRSSVLDVVSNTRRELQDFSERLGGKLGHTPADSRLEQQAQMYTAEAERAAHKRALGVDLPVESAADEVEAAVEGSVELF